jgi:hypothetical protein
MQQISEVKPSIDDKLDTCAIMLVECYEELLLKECLDIGYLNLSKARSLLGCASLSILQVPKEDLIANVKVIVNEKTNKAEDYFEYNDTEFNLIDMKSLNENTNETKAEAPTILSTPLPNWFGVLTPLSLKTSQKSFSNSLQIIKRICELQAKLVALRTTYKQLLGQSKTNSLSEITNNSL